MDFLFNDAPPPLTAMRFLPVYWKFINIEHIASWNCTKFDTTLPWAPNNIHTKCKVSKTYGSGDIRSTFKRRDICGISRQMNGRLQLYFMKIICRSQVYRQIPNSSQMKSCYLHCSLLIRFSIGAWKIWAFFQPQCENSVIHSVILLKFWTHNVMLSCRILWNYEHISIKLSLQVRCRVFSYFL